MPAPDTPMTNEAAPKPAEASPATRRIPSPVAHVIAWAALAVVNAIAIVLTPLPAGGLRVRALHHVYDAGHLVALGLLAAAITMAWERLANDRRPRLVYAALGAASAAIALLVLRPDLAGFAERLAGERATEPVAAALAVIASMSIPLARAAGELLARRPLLRAAGLGLAIAGGAANAAILANDYPGVHVYLAWTSATLGAASIAGAALPHRLGAASPRPTSRARRATAWIPLVVLAVAALPTLVLWPSNAVLIELYKLDSAVLVPLLARARARASAGRAAIPPEMQPWFTDRSAAPDIPSSAPALLPGDAAVVMLTIDSLRADVIASNTNRAALPNLLRLRDEGVYFERARSPGSGTRIALGAVFTGKHFSQLRWSDPLANRPRLDVDRSARFPELLAREGVATVTYACEPALKSAVGIARGFAEETWFDPLPGQKYGLSKEIMAEATARLRAHKGGPLFLYIHLMDPHAPYDAAGTQGAPRERYMREVALVDKAIGELLRALDEAGLAGRTALVITADHGEAFGQHNTPHHNNTLYEELLRVPLIVRVPGVPARRVEQPVSLIDLGPTVLDLMGLPTPGSFMGESLVPFLRGQSPALTRPIIAERRYAQAMIFPDDVKVILDWQKGTEELYDLTRDPSETKNLCDELGPACAARVDVLRAFFLEHARWR